MANKNKAQVVIHGSKGNKKLYDEVADSRYFKDYSDGGMALIFCTAVAVGFKENKFKKISKNKDWITRGEYIKRNTNMMRFLEAVAISHVDSLEAVSEPRKVFEIAERYADGGITKLNSMVTGSDEADFDKQVEGLMNKIINNK